MTKHNTSHNTAAAAIRNEQLSLIQSNRKELRKRGVTAGSLIILESAAYRLRGSMARVSAASLGRQAGISRAVAARHLNRLISLGAVIRIGRAIMLNIKGFLRWADVSTRSKADHLKRLYQTKRRKAVERMAGLQSSLRPASAIAGQSPVEGLPIYDRATAISELQRDYIPPHLRRNR